MERLHSRISKVMKSVHLVASLTDHLKFPKEIAPQSYMRHLQTALLTSLRCTKTRHSERTKLGLLKTKSGQKWEKSSCKRKFQQFFLQWNEQWTWTFKSLQLWGFRWPAMVVFCRPHLWYSQSQEHRQQHQHSLATSPRTFVQWLFYQMSAACCPRWTREYLSHSTNQKLNIRISKGTLWEKRWDLIRIEIYPNNPKWK